MRYLGGKALQSQYIIDILNHPKFDGMTYLEPFVGYCNILRCIKNKKKYVASDFEPLLKTLYDDIKKGVDYRKMHITKKRYKELKEKLRLFDFYRLCLN